MILISLTILPPFLILYYIIKSDRFPEPMNMIRRTFLLGVFLCIPAGIINTMLIGDTNMSYLAGLTEESLKFTALYLFLKNKIDFNEPMDAIVYGTLISLGFATLENFNYVYSADYFGMQPTTLALVRAFTAIPLHAGCGVIMGFYFGLYVFRGGEKYIFYSLCIPIIVHGFYNYIAGVNFLALIFYVILLGIFVYKLHGIYKHEQLKKINEFESRLI